MLHKHFFVLVAVLLHGSGWAQTSKPATTLPSFKKIEVTDLSDAGVKEGVIQLPDRQYRLKIPGLSTGKVMVWENVEAQGALHTLSMKDHGLQDGWMATVISTRLRQDQPSDDTTLERFAEIRQHILSKRVNVEMKMGEWQKHRVFCQTDSQSKRNSFPHGFADDPNPANLKAMSSSRFIVRGGYLYELSVFVCNTKSIKPNDVPQLVQLAADDLLARFEHMPPKEK